MFHVVSGVAFSTLYIEGRHDQGYRLLENCQSKQLKANTTTSYINYENRNHNKVFPISNSALQRKYEDHGIQHLLVCTFLVETWYRSRTQSTRSQLAKLRPLQKRRSSKSCQLTFCYMLTICEHFHHNAC